MSARDELTEHYAALMYEDCTGADWHHAHREDTADFREIADKRVADLIAEVLREAADKLTEETGPREMPYESESNKRFVAGYYGAISYIRRMAEETP